MWTSSSPATAVISIPGTTRIPRAAASAVTSAIPAVVSWSVTAATEMRAAASSSTSAAGVDRPSDSVALATQWVEPAYLEPDASWCLPGGEPASPLANGGAFGGKADSPAPGAARELADRFGRPVRVVLAREDVVRLGPKRPPIAATARLVDGVVVIDGVAAPGFPVDVVWPTTDGIAVRANWRTVEVPGPPTGAAARAVGLAEQAMLVAGALRRLPEVVTPSGARASVSLESSGDRIERVLVELAAEIGRAHV